MPPREKPIKKQDVLKEQAGSKPNKSKPVAKPVVAKPVIVPKKQTISKAELMKKAEDARLLKEEKQR